MKVIRNMSTPESRAFWKKSPEAKEIENWPAWKRAGVRSYDEETQEVEDIKMSEVEKILRRLVDAQDKLLMAYRFNRQPSSRVLDTISECRIRLAELDKRTR